MAISILDRKKVRECDFCVLCFIPSSVQFSSVGQLCLTFVTPRSAAHQAFLSITNSEFTQTHVHWVGDVIQPSHPLSSPSLPALNLSLHQGLFQWVSSSHQVARVLVLASASVLPMNIQGWFPLGLTGLTSLLSEGLLSIFSSITVWNGDSQLFSMIWIFLIDSYWKGSS